MEKSNLAIYQKYLELIYYTNDLVRKYPKSENFALVKEIKSSLRREYTHSKRQKSLKRVGRSPPEKLKYLNELDIHLNILKVHIRISYKYKYISLQNYQVWCTHITDICNMLGAWISSCLKK